LFSWHNFRPLLHPYYFFDTFATHLGVSLLHFVLVLLDRLERIGHQSRQGLHFILKFHVLHCPRDKNLLLSLANQLALRRNQTAAAERRFLWSLQVLLEKEGQSFKNLGRCLRVLDCFVLQEAQNVLPLSSFEGVREIVIRIKAFDADGERRNFNFSEFSIALDAAFQRVAASLLQPVALEVLLRCGLLNLSVVVKVEAPIACAEHRLLLEQVQTDLIPFCEFYVDQIL